MKDVEEYGFDIFREMERQADLYEVYGELHDYDLSLLEGIDPEVVRNELIRLTLKEWYKKVNELRKKMPKYYKVYI